MIKTTTWRQVVIAALLAGGSFTVAANPPPPPPVSYGVEEDVFHPVRARQGMVASVDALATRVGVDILRQGGNAVDAAVAVGYALAVTHPQAGNIGGGVKSVVERMSSARVKCFNRTFMELKCHLMYLLILKSATIIQYTIKGRFMSR